MKTAGNTVREIDPLSLNPWMGDFEQSLAGLGEA